MPEIKINAVQLVRSIRDKNYEVNKGKSHKEIMSTYRERASNLFKKPIASPK